MTIKPCNDLLQFHDLIHAGSVPPFDNENTYHKALVLHEQTLKKTLPLLAVHSYVHTWARANSASTDDGTRHLFDTCSRSDFEQHIKNGYKTAKIETDNRKMRAILQCLLRFALHSPLILNDSRHGIHIVISHFSNGYPCPALMVACLWTALKVLNAPPEYALDDLRFSLFRYDNKLYDSLGACSDQRRFMKQALYEHFPTWEKYKILHPAHKRHRHLEHLKFK